MKKTAIDPLVVNAFQTIRYLSQLAEALSLEVRLDGSPDAVDQILKVIAHCADRAEHVAQEFVPGGVVEWHEKTDFIRQCLLDDLSWMLSVIAQYSARDSLAKTLSTYPDREKLQALSLSMNLPESPPFAVFIDADNASSSVAQEFLQ